MDTCQPSQAFGVLLPTPLKQVVEVTEAPRDEPETSYTEQGVEDLRVDLEPDFRSAVVIVIRWMCHCRSGMAQDEEEHASPRHDVQTVDGDEESDGGEKISPKSTEGDRCGLPFGVLGWELVAVGIWHGWVVGCYLSG